MRARLVGDATVAAARHAGAACDPMPEPPGGARQPSVD